MAVRPILLAVADPAPLRLAVLVAFAGLAVAFLASAIRIFREYERGVVEQGESLQGRLLLLDALAMEWRTIKLARDPKCAECGQR